MELPDEVQTSLDMETAYRTVRPEIEQAEQALRRLAMAGNSGGALASLALTGTFVAQKALLPVPVFVALCMFLFGLILAATLHAIDWYWWRQVGSHRSLMVVEWDPEDTGEPNIPAVSRLRVALLGGSLLVLAIGGLLGLVQIFRFTQTTLAG
jgi:hypothetical protein